MSEYPKTQCDAWGLNGTRCHKTNKPIGPKYRSIGGRSVFLCYYHGQVWDLGEVIELEDGRYRRNFPGKFDEPSDRTKPHRHDAKIRKLEAATRKRQAGTVNLDSPESVSVMDFYLRAYNDGICYSAKDAGEMLNMHPGSVSRVIMAHPELFFGTVRLSDSGAKFWKERKEGQWQKAV